MQVFPGVTAVDLRTSEKTDDVEGFRTSEVLGGTAGYSSKNRYCPARFGTVDRYATCILSKQHQKW